MALVYIVFELLSKYNLTLSPIDMTIFNFFFLSHINLLIIIIII